MNEAEGCCNSHARGSKDYVDRRQYPICIPPFFTPTDVGKWTRSQRNSSSSPGDASNGQDSERYEEPAGFYFLYRVSSKTYMTSEIS